jgi:hypothetical protein
MRTTAKMRGRIHKLVSVATVLLVFGSVARANVQVRPASLNFGSLSVGSTSATRNVTITNENRHAVTISSASVTIPQFSLSAPLLPVTLEPGQTLSVAVTFKPSTVQAYAGRLELTRSYGWPISVELSGTGSGPAPPALAPVIAPAISSQPASTSIIAGQSATFGVVATGTAPMAYQWAKNGAAIAGATSSSYQTPIETTADNQAKLTVVVSNSAGSATSSAATLRVTAASFLLNSSLSSMSFGSVTVSGSQSLSATLTNGGNSNVTISNVTVSGAGFNATGIPAGLILAPGQTATLTATFAPSAAGSESGSVSVASNATNSPDSITLSGTGTAPVAHSVQLAWTSSTSTVVGYNAYWSSQSGGPYTKLTSTPDAALSYTDASVQAGQTYYFVVTSVDSTNTESAYSSEVSAVVP